MGNIVGKLCLAYLANYFLCKVMEALFGAGGPI